MSSGTPPAPNAAPSAAVSADAGRVWTPKTLLEWTAGWFGTKGIATPRLDAELLLAHVLGLKRLDLYLQFDRPLSTPELAAYRELVRKRADRTPVAYLVEEVGFWSLTLDIAPGCLIPRPDTETLVEAVVDAIAELRGGKPNDPGKEIAPGMATPVEAEGHLTDWAAIDAAAGSDAIAHEAASGQDAALESHQPASLARAVQPPISLTVLELGTGSAAIPLAVCSETQAITWVAVERSKEAMAVARRNARRYAALLEPKGNRLWLVRGDGFAAVRAEAPIDLIVSNPPYIRGGEIAGLMAEVSAHEPHAALDGGADGLAFYRLLIGEAARRLRPGGRLIVEIGHDQFAGVEALVVSAADLSVVGTHKDLAGHTRVVDVRKM